MAWEIHMEEVTDAHSAGRIRYYPTPNHESSERIGTPGNVCTLAPRFNKNMEHKKVYGVPTGASSASDDGKRRKMHKDEVTDSVRHALCKQHPRIVPSPAEL